jgi:hypothetical protein
MKTLLGDFNAGVEEKMFSNKESGMRFFTKLIEIVGSDCYVLQHKNLFPQHNIHKCTRNSPDGKTHNLIYHVLADKSGIHMYLMSETLEVLTAILTIIWWFRNLEANSP